MNETPEAVRERIHAEELAKGSDPRVAEARAKAAEMRARHGLPIDPQEAWKAKLEKEGGAPSQAAPKPPEAEVAEQEPTEQQEPTTEEVAAPVAEEEPAPRPEDASPATPAVAPQEPAAAPQPAEPEVPFDPEIGEILVVPQTVSEIGGVKVRDERLPAWLMVILLAIPLWAILYLLALGGDDVARRTSECEIQPDHSFVCFLPEEESGGDSSGGH